MSTRETDRAATAAIFLVVLMGLWLLLTPSCKSASKPLVAIEAMEPRAFDLVEARADLITRVLFQRLYDQGTLTANKISNIAFALEATADNPTTPGGSALISNAFKDWGFTDQEALLAIVLVEDFLRSRVDLGSASLPIGPNARRLLLAVSRAMRSAIKEPLSAEENEAAESLMESAR